jgi:hypothetical protein
MNKLVIPNGGMPLHGDDFDFIHNSNLEAFKGLIHLYAAPHNGNMILSGCEVTGNTVAAGYVLIDYEVCYFAGGVMSNSVPNYSYRYILTVVYDASGKDVFADSVTRDTYQVRRAGLYDTDDPGVAFNGPRLDKAIWAIVESFNTERQLTSFVNGWSDVGQTYVKLLPGGMKCIHGSLAVGAKSTSSLTKVLTLPAAEYRPSFARQIAHSFADPTLRHGLFIFNQNGDVEYLAGDNLAVNVPLLVCLVYR